jgi:hypothetical protein
LSTPLDAGRLSQARAERPMRAMPRRMTKLQAFGPSSVKGPSPYFAVAARRKVSLSSSIFSRASPSSSW